MESKLIALMDKIEAGVTKVAPDAFAAVGRALFWEGMTRILTVVVLVIASIVLLRWALRLFCDPESWANVRNTDSYSSSYSYYMHDDGRTAVIFTTGILLLVTVVVSCGVLFDSMTWMCLFDQKAAIAAKLINHARF